MGRFRDLAADYRVPGVADRSAATTSSAVATPDPAAEFCDALKAEEAADEAEATAMAGHYAAAPQPSAYTPTTPDTLRDGLRHAALQRPRSWENPSAAPSLGAWCVDCCGQRWWREGTKGWRCWSCIPPAAGEVVELRT